jgi:hypothetical protein
MGYWLSRRRPRVGRDPRTTWTLQGSPVEGAIGPMFDPKDENHLAVAGAKGIFETTGGGRTWKAVASLPEAFSAPKAGGYANVDWDPARGLYYALQMGRGTFRLEVRWPEGSPAAGAAGSSWAGVLGPLGESLIRRRWAPSRG